MTTILAIQPNGDRMGYAVFEGAELIDWGVKALGASLPVRERITKKAIPVFNSLVYRYEPQVVVIPDATKVFTGRGFFIQSIPSDSALRSYRVLTFTRRDIQSCFKTLQRKSPTNCSNQDTPFSNSNEPTTTYSC